MAGRQKNTEFNYWRPIINGTKANVVLSISVFIIAK